MVDWLVTQKIVILQVKIDIPKFSFHYYNSFPFICVKRKWFWVNFSFFCFLNVIFAGQLFIPVRSFFFVRCSAVLVGAFLGKNTPKFSGMCPISPPCVCKFTRCLYLWFLWFFFVLFFFVVSFFVDCDIRTTGAGLVFWLVSCVWWCGARKTHEMTYVL